MGRKHYKNRNIYDVVAGNIKKYREATVLHNKTLLIELAILMSILEGSNRQTVEVVSLLRVFI